ncbi:beta-phosphoglucomutase [Romboutsia weinsteinii]|uniref:Beta-phosphoglucomutase n=1 Tax=Romboutsia weinsteinii TaxID=2020949 RepID=A0A371J5L0_9FIRM|nr:beta-phosphoglucomutase [Romboutsia weinsteinii]RDY28071.1 beta-phosphoglucomutase [Romboutsia weinsteinii]
MEAFIFDLDGVITDTAHYHYIAWKELAKSINIDIDEKFNESLKGISRLESLESILKLKGREYDFSYEEKVILANKKNDYYKELIKNVTPKDILPGIKELLNETKDKGIKIGLASASKNADAVLQNLQLKDYFDFVADASKCTQSKPNPEIFLMAIKGLNVDPKDCIGFEDASAGIEAINSANMYSVGIGDENVLKEANYIVKNTTDLDFNTLIKKYIQYYSK